MYIPDNLLWRLRRLVPALLLCMASCTNEGLEPGENCFDGVKNQDEVGVDCGGICDRTCPASLTATVNGSSWAADSAKISSGYTSGSSTLKITGSPASGVYPRLQLVYVGPLTLGTHNLDPISSYLPNLSAFIVFNSGSITFTSVDSRNKVLYGGFNLSCTDTATSTTYNVTSGQFAFIAY